MNDFYLYIWVVVGVLASLVIPVVWRLAFPGTTLPQGFGPAVSQLWANIRPYFLIGMASALVGLVAFAIVKSTGGKFDHWYTAFLNGYFWDATLQKFKKGA